MIPLMKTQPVDSDNVANAPSSHIYDIEEDNS